MKPIKHTAARKLHSRKAAKQKSMASLNRNTIASQKEPAQTRTKSGKRVKSSAAMSSPPNNKKSKNRRIIIN